MNTQFMARPLLAAVALLQIVACTGHIVPPTPTKPPVPPNNGDYACPTMIPDQNTSSCPRLKNITLSGGRPEEVIENTGRIGFWRRTGWQMILRCKTMTIRLAQIGR
jgi:hypothetical protein